MPALHATPSKFLAVLFRMLPCGIVLVVSGLQVMTECNPGMMRGPLVVACLVMLRGLAMMLGRLFHSVAPLVRDARES